MDLRDGNGQMKRPMTTAEYFNKVCKILKEKGVMPQNFLDYSLATSNPVPMKTYQFNVRNNLDYGGSEGIYLDLWIEFYEDGEKQIHDVGIFKTLLDGQEAMRTMAQLLADFVAEQHRYVNEHLDDFTWTGVDVYPVGMNGTKLNFGYSCATMEKALVRKEELLQKCPCVVVRDNATRKETRYMKKGA